MILKLSDFDYFLPKGLIAQEPALKRDSSKLLVVDRLKAAFVHSEFRNIANFLKAGDVLVLNDTKVLPLRFNGKRKTGGHVELLLLKDLGQDSYIALIKPLARLKDGETIFLSKGFSCVLVDAKKKIIRFNPPGAKEAIEKIGILPLPPYVRRKPTAMDKKRYQTVFAEKSGAVAAPTAGLHFTKSLLSEIRKKGIEVHFLTLHVNYATFSPVRSLDISQHRMEEEYFEIPASTVEAVRRAKKDGRRVVCVGTTVCKALEDGAKEILRNGEATVLSKTSRLFIHPPFSFRITDALITNFHLPRTTLLMLVAAFAGRDFILSAYREATKNNYRFYSYGDAMLIA